MGIMKLSLGSRGLALVCTASLALGACGRIDSVRMTFPSGQKPFGTITLVATAMKMAVGKKGISPSLAKEIENCGLKTSLAERADRFRLDASLAFPDGPSLTKALDCFPADWSKRSVTLSTIENFWSTDYVAIIWFEQPRLVNGNGEFEQFYPATGGRAGHFVAPLVDIFPIELSVEMPANVVAIEDLSAIYRARTEHSEQGNIAVIKYTPNRDQRIDPALHALAQEAQDGAQVTIPQNRYKFVIRARKNKFEIGSLGIVLTLLSLVFGSGIGVQAFGWLRARRAANREAA